MSTNAKPSGTFDGAGRRLIGQCAAFVLSDESPDRSPDLTSLEYGFRSERNRQALIDELASAVGELSDGKHTVCRAAMDLFVYTSTSACLYLAVCPSGQRQPLITHYQPDIVLFTIRPIRYGIEVEID